MPRCLHITSEDKSTKKYEIGAILDMEAITVTVIPPPSYPLPFHHLLATRQEAEVYIIAKCEN